MREPDAELENLKLRLREFAEARDWAQFHTPKNLAMALIAEAAEVVEHFQWLTEAEAHELPSKRRAEVELELADVLLYLIMLADKLGVDLGDAARRKIAINASRYPVETARGHAKQPSDPSS